MALDDFVPDARNLKLLAVILNVIPFLAGIGTIVGAIKDGVAVKPLIVGILQFILQIGIVGYIWSVIWAVLIYRK